MNDLNRRNFLKKATLSAAAVSVFSRYLRAGSERPIAQKYMGDFASPKLENVRAAFIGVGVHGVYHLSLIHI